MRRRRDARPGPARARPGSAVLVCAAFGGFAVGCATRGGIGESPLPSSSDGSDSPAPTAVGRPSPEGSAALQEVRRLFEEAHGPNRSPDDREAFVAAFERASWEEFDPRADGKLLRSGCRRVATRALAAGDGEAAVRAMEFYASRFPEDGRGDVARLLPAANALAGDFALAESRFEEFTRHADPSVAGWACVHLGDLRLARGDPPGPARAAWHAAAAVPTPQSAGGDLRLAQQAAAHRLRSVGAVVPSLGDEGATAVDWVVGDPSAAEAPAGRVAVVLPFETTCHQCRQMLHALQRLHEDRADRGLQVIGLLRPQSEGRLPHPGARDLWTESDLVTIPAGGMRQHAAEFARNSGLTFPVGILSMETWRRWALLGWHPILVIGRDGRVAFLTAGGDSMALVRVCVDRLLATQPE